MIQYGVFFAWSLRSDLTHHATSTKASAQAKCITNSRELFISMEVYKCSIGKDVSNIFVFVGKHSSCSGYYDNE